MENFTDEIDLSKRRAERKQQHDRDSGPDLKQDRGFYRTRLFLRFVVFAFSLAIVVALCDDLRWYFKTRHVTNTYRDGSGEYPVWPPGLKLWPTYILLGAAFGAALVSLLLIVASLHPNVRRMTKTGNITTMVVSSVCLVLWIVVTAYYHSWDSKKTNWDLMSWSCTHQDPSFDYRDIDFSEFCTEFRFAYWAGVGLAIMEALNLAVFVFWWVRNRRARGYAMVHDG
ncbi:hypothetical protein ACN47E_007207 [Coniothyrium glycines]